MAKYIWNEAKEQTLVSMFNNGETFPYIANALNMTTGVVGYRLYKSIKPLDGLDKSKRSSMKNKIVWTAEMDEVVKDMRDVEKSVFSKIAKKLNLTTTQVMNRYYRSIVQNPVLGEKKPKTKVEAVELYLTKKGFKTITRGVATTKDIVSKREYKIRNAARGMHQFWYMEKSLTSVIWGCVDF